MKLYYSFIFAALSLFGNAQESNILQDSTVVRGVCEMCKSRIEKAVQSVPTANGVWDVQTKVLQLSFDSTQTNTKEILKKVAQAGHDNEYFLADDSTYNNLPACCLYNREGDIKEYHLNETATHGKASPTQHHTEEDEKAEGHDKMPETNKHEQHNNKPTQSDDDAIELDAASITSDPFTTKLDGDAAGLTFDIKEGELLKAACCNLSESFETNASVDVAYTNAVTGTKQLTMLGLNQKYTLITKELLPEIRGLGSAMGLNFIPGRWISGIQLTKGGSSVTNGYESITGHINTELHQYQSKPKNSINLFADFNSRLEANLVSTKELNSNWGQSILLHANSIVNRVDHNNDGFMDRPIGSQINLSYLLKYDDLDDSGVISQTGLNLINDERLAGQVNFKENTDQLTTNAYGVGIDTKRFQLWNKTGYIFKDKPYQSIGLMNQFTYHQQDSYFGLREYTGNQKTIYSNLIFESILGDTFHQYKTGLSFLYDWFDEDYNQTNYQRTETVPGAFFEYTYTGLNFTAVAGARVDFHNLAGTQFTPRINLKYDVTESTTLRASAGRGFRTANIFAENQGYFASNRTLNILSNNGDIYGLQPEIAWNYGASVQQTFNVFGRKSALVADFFRTDFKQQVVVDLDASSQQLNFYNLKGDSFANSLQIQWDFEPINRLDVRLAYKYYDTFVDYDSGENQLPFTPNHRGFLNLAYATQKTTKNKQWTIDATLQWVGEQRIPFTKNNPQALQLPEVADAFFLFNTQVAYQFNKTLRAYAGADNLFGYTQDMPIVDAQNPFGSYFDGGMVYAPIMPGNFYVGLDIDF